MALAGSPLMAMNASAIAIYREIKYLEIVRNLPNVSIHYFSVLGVSGNLALKLNDQCSQVE